MRRFGRHTFFALGFYGAVIASLLSGCGKKDDAISQAEKKDKDQPSIAEVKAIAEEGFIYGLPSS